jgi:adenylate kinase family enzyme
LSAEVRRSGADLGDTLPLGARIAVIGSGGSGKSTFARQLGARLGLPVIHLDKLFWQPGWVEMPPPEWRAAQEKLVARESWIIDGNHEATLDVRLSRADTIVMLDYGRVRCLWRVFRRWQRYRNKPRYDRAAGCNERLNLGFLSWVWRYPKQGRPRALEAVERYGSDARFVRLRNPRGTRRFLTQLSQGAFRPGPRRHKRKLP